MVFKWKKSFRSACMDQIHRIRFIGSSSPDSSFYPGASSLFFWHCCVSCWTTGDFLLPRHCCVSCWPTDAKISTAFEDEGGIASVLGTLLPPKSASWRLSSQPKNFFCPLTAKKTGLTAATEGNNETHVLQCYFTSIKVE